MKITRWTSEDKALNVCGLSYLNRFNYTQTSYEELTSYISYADKITGNYIFAIKDAQLFHPTDALKKLLESNTKIIHYYKNNAHEPFNYIFICICHLFPEDVDVVIDNNIEEIKAKFKFIYGHAATKV